MKIYIETNIKNDLNTKNEVWTSILDYEELANVVKNHGIEAANQALDQFTDKFVKQFKEKLGSYLNA